MNDATTSSVDNSKKQHRLRRFMIGAAVAAALVVGVPTIANANTYSNSWSGTDYVTRSTTLNYAAPHGNFTLHVWVTTTGWFVSDRYSIVMYDSVGRTLWSASGQGDRQYAIGGNVTRIVINRDSAQGAVTNWYRW